ncbi:hypothetical protein ACFPJ1_39230 [Kribbella qitaiheensis]|uniref:hypothetical protein n=1 Tax=Kribbella qitaiheensis TaxID=1544730 RepID=UPI00361A09B1
MNWQRAGDLGLWSSFALLVIIESGARNDPYWMQAIFLAVLAASVLLRRSWPIIGLSLVITTQVAILAVNLGTTNGVQIAMIPAISVLSYLSTGRR